MEGVVPAAASSCQFASKTVPVAMTAHGLIYLAQFHRIKRLATSSQSGIRLEQGMIRRHKTDKKYQPDLLATSWHFGFFLLFIAFTVQAADVLDDLKRLDTDIENRRSKATEITKANEKKILMKYLKDLEGHRELARGKGQLNGVVFFDHEIKRTEKALINDPNLMFELDPGPKMPNGAPIKIPIELQKMRATLRTDLGAASGRLAAYDKKLNEEKLNLHQAAERRLVRDNRIDDAKIVRGQIQLLGLAPDPVALAGGPAAPAAAQGFRGM